MKVLKKEDAGYPESLENILNPPKTLYILGDEANLNKKGIAIIGSRVCTEEGKQIAKEFAFKLSKMGLCIISGMAKGIDTAAHIGALEAGERTIAVLGAGFNNIFPEENKELLKQIIKGNGTVITEYPKDTKICSQGFIQRNRIVSGLSEAVLVIEAKHRSGTAVTADFARKQGKTIFCIPHSLNQKEGIGTNRLLQKGAILVTRPEDIQKYLKLEKIKSFLKENITINIPEEYLDIYNQIGESPTNIEEVCKKLKKDIDEINYGLTMLEIQGYICSMPGKNFKRL